MSDLSTYAIFKSESVIVKFHYCFTKGYCVSVLDVRCDAFVDTPYGFTHKGYKDAVIAFEKASNASFKELRGRCNAN